MNEAKKVFIILLNWNNWNETRECLESLEKIDYKNFEVIVADNNSSKDEKNKIKQFCLLPKPYTLTPIFNDANLGFAGGNNVGIKYALEQDADYIMLLNNDTVVAPNFLEKLVEAGEKNPKFGILGSKIYKYGGDEIVFAGGKINKWLTKAKHSNSAGSDPAELETGYITGAAMLVKREVIERVGLMREEYFLYYEDVDWCLKARRAGYKRAVVPESKIWHKVSATNKEGSASYIYYHTRNGLMLAKFNGNIFQKSAAYFIGVWILAKQAIKFFLMPSKRLWVNSMAKGVLDFYMGKYGKYDPSTSSGSW